MAVLVHREEIAMRLTSLRLVSWIHGLWGVSILAFPLFGVAMPRPFGSQEAFLLYMPPWLMAAMLLSGALFCRLMIFAGARQAWPWAKIAGAVPQQLLLLYSSCWGFWTFLDDLHEGNFDARGWLALCYLAALSTYHGRDVMQLWAELGQWRDGTIGNARS